MNGIDISAYQGTIDFAAVARSGSVQFVYAKASEGVSVTDDRFREYHDGFKSVHVPFGPYHLLHFASDAVAQADHFLSVINGYQGQLLPMVDVEAAGFDGVTAFETLVNTLATFLQRVEAQLHGKRCIIYTNWSDWNDLMQGTDDFSGHPLWIAEYTNAAQPTLPRGFGQWVLWQYTNTAIVQGIDGYVDADRLNGSTLRTIMR